MIFFSLAYCATIDCRRLQHWTLVHEPCVCVESTRVLNQRGATLSTSGPKVSSSSDYLELTLKSRSTLNMWNQTIVKQLQQQSCYIYHWHHSNTYVQLLNACFLFKCLQGSRTSENMFISIQPRAKMGWRVQLTSGMGQRSPVRYKKILKTA